MNLLDILNMKKREFLTFSLLLIIGISFRVHYGFQKEHYHIDEIWSLELINVKDHLTLSRPDFFNTWHNGDFFKKDLTIESDEKLRFDKIILNTANDVHPPIYYFLLHIFVILISNGAFSVWGGIILNIFIFIFSIFFFYRLSKLILKDHFYALTACVLWGMSFAAVSNSMFIRMYELLTFACILILYLSIIFLQKDKKTAKDYIVLGMAIIFGFLTHYYFLIFAVPLFSILNIYLFKNKRYKELAGLLKTITLSFCFSLISFPWAFNHFFQTMRGQQALYNLFAANGFWNNTAEYLNLLNEALFWGAGIPIFFLLITLSIIGKMIFKKETLVFLNREIILILVPALFYFLMIIKIAPYIAIRYIQLSLPFFVLTFLYILFKATPLVLLNKKHTYSLSLLLSITCIASLVNGNIFYLYKGEKTKWAMYDRQPEIPSVFLVSDKYSWRLIPEFPTLSKRESTLYLQTKDFTKKNMAGYLNDVNTSKGIYLFLYNDDPKKEKILMDFTNINNFTKYNFYSKTAYKDVYYIN